MTYHLSQAVSILMYFILGTRYPSTLDESFNAVLEARRLLGLMADRNVNAMHIYNNLDSLISSRKAEIVRRSGSGPPRITARRDFLAALGIHEGGEEEG